MTISSQDQFTAFSQQFQNATSMMVDAWTRAAQEATLRSASATVQKASHQAIDQAYDLTVTLVDIQRNVAKEFVSATAKAAEEATERVTRSATEAVARVGQGVNAA